MCYDDWPVRPSVRPRVPSPSVREGSEGGGGSSQPASLVHFWRRQTSASERASERPRPSGPRCCSSRYREGRGERRRRGPMLQRRRCMPRDVNNLVSTSRYSMYPHLHLLNHRITLYIFTRSNYEPCCIFLVTIYYIFEVGRRASCL